MIVLWVEVSSHEDDLNLLKLGVYITYIYPKNNRKIIIQSFVNGLSEPIRVLHSAFSFAFKVARHVFQCQTYELIIPKLEFGIK
jgi:hypothetical protein